VNWSSVFCMFGMALTRPRHWQCNWRSAWTSSRMSASKRRTLRATIVTIFSYMRRDVSVFVKCDMIFRLLFWKLPQFHTYNFRKVLQQHTKGMVRSIIYVVGNLLGFCCWKNFENTLRIDKVIAMSMVYYFFGARCLSLYLCIFSTAG